MIYCFLMITSQHLQKVPDESEKSGILVWIGDESLHQANKLKYILVFLERKLVGLIRASTAVMRVWL